MDVFERINKGDFTVKIYTGVSQIRNTKAEEELLLAINQSHDRERVLREALENIEMVADDGQQCPVCYGTWVHDKGHAKDCWLKTELDKLKGVE